MIILKSNVTPQMLAELNKKLEPANIAYIEKLLRDHPELRPFPALESGDLRIGGQTPVAADLDGAWDAALGAQQPHPSDG